MDNSNGFRAITLLDTFVAAGRKGDAYCTNH
jgi:hypothetical protein